MWTQNQYGGGDPYWIAVLHAIECGDRLYAPGRAGFLRFQTVDGRMRIFDGNGNGANLWDWQDAKYYVIDRGGLENTDRVDEKFSDQIFESAESFREGGLGFHYMFRPKYSYSRGAGGVEIAHEGFYQVLRTNKVNFSGALDVVTGHRYNWMPGADYLVDGILLFVHPGVGIGKFVLDVGATGYNTFADPMYRYDVMTWLRWFR